MREFFRGWRRKMGVIALLVACVIMAVWTRGQVLEDEIAFTAFHRRVACVSKHGGVAIQVFDARMRLAFELPEWLNGEIVDGPDDVVTFPLVAEHRRVEAQMPSSIFVIAYRTLVTPLTLLSAYLLLTKPRPKPKQPVTHA